jgi:hypothetical protein
LLELLAATTSVSALSQLQFSVNMIRIDGQSSGKTID